MADRSKVAQSERDSDNKENCPHEIVKNREKGSKSKDSASRKRQPEYKSKVTMFQQPFV